MRLTSSSIGIDVTLNQSLEARTPENTRRSTLVYTSRNSGAIFEVPFTQPESRKEILWSGYTSEPLPESLYPGPRLARPSAAIDTLCSSFFPLATLILCPQAEANQFGYYAFRVIASFAILVNVYAAKIHRNLLVLVYCQ